MDESSKIAGEDVSKWDIRDQTKSNLLSEIIAEAHQVVGRSIMTEFGPLLDTLGEAQAELEKALTPQMPPSPDQLLAQVEAQKNQNQIQVDNARVNLDAVKAQRDYELKLRDMALKEKESDEDHVVSMAKIAVATAQIEETKDNNEKNHALAGMNAVNQIFGGSV